MADSQDKDQAQTLLPRTSSQVMASKALTEEVSDEIQTPNDAAKFNLAKKTDAVDTPKMPESQMVKAPTNMKNSSPPPSDDDADLQADNKDEEGKQDAVQAYSPKPTKPMSEKHQLLDT